MEMEDANDVPMTDSAEDSNNDARMTDSSFEPETIRFESPCARPEDSSSENFSWDQGQHLQHLVDFVAAVHVDRALTEEALVVLVTALDTVLSVYAPRGLAVRTCINALQEMGFWPEAALHPPTTMLAFESSLYYFWGTQGNWPGHRHDFLTRVTGLSRNCHQATAQDQPAQESQAFSNSIAETEKMNAPLIAGNLVPNETSALEDGGAVATPDDTSQQDGQVSDYLTASGTMSPPEAMIMAATVETWLMEVERSEELPLAASDKSQISVSEFITESSTSNQPGKTMTIIAVNNVGETSIIEFERTQDLPVSLEKAQILEFDRSETSIMGSMNLEEDSQQISESFTDSVPMNTPEQITAVVRVGPDEGGISEHSLASSETGRSTSAAIKELEAMDTAMILDSSDSSFVEEGAWENSLATVELDQISELTPSSGMNTGEMTMTIAATIDEGECKKMLDGTTEDSPSSVLPAPVITTSCVLSSPSLNLPVTDSTSGDEKSGVASVNALRRNSKGGNNSTESVARAFTALKNMKGLWAPRWQVANAVPRPAVSGFPKDTRSRSRDKAKDELREKQKRLLLLRHASRCRYDKCPVTKHCATLKALWKHWTICESRPCTFNGCTSGRSLLKHYNMCTDVSCLTCEPVREEIENSRRQERSSSWPKQPPMPVSMTNSTPAPDSGAKSVQQPYVNTENAALCLANLDELQHSDSEEATKGPRPDRITRWLGAGNDDDANTENAVLRLPNSNEEADLRILRLRKWQSSCDSTTHLLEVENNNDVNTENAALLLTNLNEKDGVTDSESEEVAKGPHPDFPTYFLGVENNIDVNTDRAALPIANSKEEDGLAGSEEVAMGPQPDSISRSGNE